MKIFQHKLTMICSVLLALAGFSCQASAQTLFTDDFEDRVKDQDLIGPGWTWYNQAYADDQCTEYSSGFGPFDEQVLNAKVSVSGIAGIADLHLTAEILQLRPRVSAIEMEEGSMRAVV